MPGVVRDFLDAAGAADAVPWDGRPVVSPTDASFCRPQPPAHSWAFGAGPGEGLGTFDPAALSEAEWQELLSGGDPDGGDHGTGNPHEGDPGAWDPGSAEGKEAAGSSGGWSGGAGERGRREAGARRRILAKPPLQRDDGLDQGADDEAMPGVYPQTLNPETSTTTAWTRGRRRGHTGSAAGAGRLAVAWR